MKLFDGETHLLFYPLFHFIHLPPFLLLYFLFSLLSFLLSLFSFLFFNHHISCHVCRIPSLLPRMIHMYSPPSPFPFYHIILFHLFSTHAHIIHSSPSIFIRLTNTVVTLTFLLSKKNIFIIC